MLDPTDYLAINKKTWNQKTAIHYDSDFYDNDNFIKGNSSLQSIELDLLGDISHKKILHLQCHFGQDSISMSRMGAQVTGMDLSDKAIEKARQLAQICQTDTKFVCTDVYSLPQHLEGQFDIVFTSYGVIGWLPDLDKWAGVIEHFLKPNGKLVFVEFHPVVWMFDDDFEEIKYRYFNTEPIIEEEEGTYADMDAKVQNNFVGWNHGLSEVMTALLKKNLCINSFDEFDYSPYPCFRHVEEIAPKKFRIKKLGNKIPMVYALTATKKCE